MAEGGGGSDGDVGFQIAPMIDLILVLMVFFMSTVALKQVENELGFSGLGKGEARTIPMNVGIDEAGVVTLNNDPKGTAQDRDLPKLRTALKEQVAFFSDKIPIVIIPQPDVPHYRVIDVLNACSAVGAKNISFGG